MRRRHLRGGERELEHRENRRIARGKRRDHELDYDRHALGDLDGESEFGNSTPDHDPMRRRGRRSRDAAGAQHDAPRPARSKAALASVASGTVIARHHHHFEVQRDGRDDRTTLRVRSRPTDEPLVVGDRVHLGIDPGDGEFLLLERAPRRTVLERSDPSDASGRSRLALAANVDILIGVQPLSRARPGLIDRLAVAAAAADLELFVCIHKTDLLRTAAPTDVLHETARELESRAQAVQATAVRTSCPENDDASPQVTELRDAIGARCAVLVGPSGAGKSSLTNALVPGLRLDTRAVRGGDGKGRHTTTAAGWFALPGGGSLIDTPGVRAFGLQQPDPHTLARAFPDVTAFARDCRFRDCRHDAEPDCAVRAAVERGELPRHRLDAWQRIAASSSPPT